MKHKALNIPTSIIISGVESERYWDIVVRQCGMRFVLMSYHYLQKKPKDFLKKRIEEFPDLKVFIDSGAYTFLTNSDKFQDKPLKFWEDYLQEYTDWVKDNHEYIFACANLDIEFLVGNEQVDEWNDKYFLPVEEAGVEVCYIWHTPRGEQGWEQMCKKHSYIGMSMENDKEFTVQRLMKRMKVAQKYNTRVHGMALTKTEILVRVPFFSADSSVDGNSKVLVRYKTKNPTVPYKMEQLSIKELYDRNIDWEFRTSDFETRVPYKDVEVLTVDNNNNTVWGSLYGVVKHIVKKPTIKLKVQGGKEVICTTDHSIITMDSEGNLIETKADTLKVGDYVLSPKAGKAFRGEKPNYINADVNVNGITFLKIKEIEQVTDGTEEVEVYDLSVEKYERFFANGILVHNTTWLVGQQYGELNWFNGRKMQRLSKQEWRREYKTKLLKEPFNANWDLLINGMGGRGDTYELLRLNVIAYKLAEEHIRKRLRTKMYWMKGGATEMDSEEKLKKLDLPPYEWYHAEKSEGWEDYLQKLGISPADYTEEEGVNLLYYFFLFLVDEDNHIEELDDETLISYAQSVAEGEEIEDRDGAIEFLTNYFRDNATGKRTDFIGEEGMNIPKERESYVMEDEFTIIDLSAQEIEQNFGMSLPAPRDNSMPEIDEFDEELRRQDIIPVRDANGRFIKGQKKVRKPRNVYSDKYPKLHCSTCYKSGECPEYREGYVCAYDKMFKRFDTRDAQDIMDSMASMVNFNLTRMQRAMIFETLDGGMITPEVSNLIDQNMRLLEKMKDLVSNAPKAVVSQKRVIREDGTEEVVTEMNVSNPNQGGILSKLFGSDDDKPKNKPKKDDENIVDADYEVNEE